MLGFVSDAVYCQRLLERWAQTKVHVERLCRFTGAITPPMPLPADVRLLLSRVVSIPQQIERSLQKTALTQLSGGTFDPLTKLEHL